MAKSRARNQIANLTLDHKKSRIALIYLHEGNLPHTVGKLLTRTTTLLQTSSQLEVLKKLWASKVAEVPILGISRFQFGSPRTK